MYSYGTGGRGFHKIMNGAHTIGGRQILDFENVNKIETLLKRQLCQSSGFWP